MSIFNQRSRGVSDDDNNFAMLFSTQDSKNCSLTAQRSRSGRLGRRTMFANEQQQSDSALVRAVCRAQGIGRARYDEDIMNLAEWSCNEGREDKSEVGYRRACSCVADIKMSSLNEARRKEGLSLLKSSADAGDGYGLLRFGVAYERGDEGVAKDEKHAKELYMKCENSGFLDATLLSGAVGEKEKLKTEEKEWNWLMYRIRFNTIPMHDLNLSSLSRKEDVFFPLTL